MEGRRSVYVLMCVCQISCSFFVLRFIMEMIKKREARNQEKKNRATDIRRRMRDKGLQTAGISLT